MLRYAITNRTLFAGDEARQQAALVEQCTRWAAAGIDFIQLREKDLGARDLAAVARTILEVLHIAGAATKLLINSRPDVAIAVAADGVHLTSAPGGLTPAQVRALYAAASLAPPALSISCHTLAEVERARQGKVDAILFAPIFQKSVADHQVAPGVGLEHLHAACALASPIPVYALGGITLENTAVCIGAGAAGVAGIRLFHTPVTPCGQ